jgi:hypothetical protein
MDVETTAAVESLRDEMGSLRGEVGSLREEMNERFDAVNTRFEGVGARFDKVEASIEDLRDELKRHTSVLFESLRDDVRILAEGVAASNAKGGTRKRPTR